MDACLKSRGTQPASSKIQLPRTRVQYAVVCGVVPVVEGLTEYSFNQRPGVPWLGISAFDPVQPTAVGRNINLASLVLGHCPHSGSESANTS